MDASVKHKLVLIKEVFVNCDNNDFVKELFNDKHNENGNKLRTYKLYKKLCDTSHYVRVVKYKDHHRILCNF